MCDKKNNVLFTDTACFVMSPDFKLPDESQVLLKVPRKNNMYSVDMKNIVPKESLTCLVAKATLDESMLWHRRLGHINFKTINKLVKDNLVRGLPAKHFENDQTCVACLKGKQHKASCKSKIQNSITQPLFMLHMDLFGPTFVSSLMNKKYCLVVTDDYSRFTWVFFLASKDETSGILKNFIIDIENLVDKKVKIIRCDNRTEFKNRVMNEFCEKKGIKREFSVARTPQQNGVAKRRNRTLIEAARTMLADSKSRTPALSFMRPFGCHVTILDSLDHLGKFDGKSDDGFFVGYSLTSKAFRFLENKPIVRGDGPKWLFDINSLTKSMNYVPVVAGTNSNDFVGSEESNGVGDSSKETEFSQDYIVMPLWKDGSMFDSSSKYTSDDEPQPSSNAEKRMMKVIATLEATHADLFVDETEIDMSNLTTSYQTRGMTKNTNEHGFISAVYEGKTHEDLHTCLFPCFLSQEEQKRIAKSLSVPAWVEAMQEELLQFKLQKVWILVDLPKGFMVYQMGVKSAFLYDTIEDEVYVCQPLGFEDPDYPDKVYKLVKALYGLHQAPRACQDKYIAEILRKFGFTDVRTASTPMDTEKPLLKDSDGDDVDCKKQTVVATSSTEVEYVAAASCCGQNPVSDTKTKHIEIRYHFIRDCYDKKLIQVVKIYKNHNFADLLTKALDVGRIREANNVNMQSRMNGRTCNIKQRCVMCQTPRQIKRVQDTKIPQSSGPPKKVGDEAIHKESGDRMERVATTAFSLEVEQDSGTNNRTQSIATLNEPSP
ncbi:putative ribonuclease H-like domain-containing protein [Tanacetum coccineum]